MASDLSEVKAALERVFAHDLAIYNSIGFAKRLGYGKRPAVVIIDMANAWTRSNGPFLCEDMDNIIPATQKLLAAARAKQVPVVYTTTAFAVVDGPNPDTGMIGRKVPFHKLKLGSETCEIDERLKPQGDEQVLVKKRASAFNGTYLNGFLTANQVDTVIVTGVTMAGCVRHTVEDAIAEGYRPIVVRECVGDRVPGAVEWNLFDIDTKFGDVEPLANVLAYLERLPPRDQRS